MLEDDNTNADTNNKLSSGVEKVRALDKGQVGNPAKKPIVRMKPTSILGLLPTPVQK